MEKTIQTQKKNMTPSYDSELQSYWHRVLVIRNEDWLDLILNLSDSSTWYYLVDMAFLPKSKLIHNHPNVLHEDIFFERFVFCFSFGLFFELDCLPPNNSTYQLFWMGVSLVRVWINSENSSFVDSLVVSRVIKN